MPKFIQSKLFLILEIFFLMFTLFTLVKIVNKKEMIAAEIEDLTKQIQTFSSENEDLTYRLSKTNFDSYLELQAKRKLNYRKPGETVYIFYEDDIAPEERVATVGNYQEADLNMSSNPAKWWQYFFNQ